MTDNRMKLGGNPKYEFIILANKKTNIIPSKGPWNGSEESNEQTKTNQSSGIPDHSAVDGYQLLGKVFTAPSGLETTEERRGQPSSTKAT